MDLLEGWAARQHHARVPRQRISEIARAWVLTN